MAIDDNTSYELTGYQVKDLAQKIRAKADSTSLASVATSGLYSDLTGAPTIPTVYNGTLTIQHNGSNVQTFTANSSTNATANIETIYADTVAPISTIGAITTNNIADSAVTSAKIGWSSLPLYHKTVTATTNNDGFIDGVLSANYVPINILVRDSNNARHVAIMSQGNPITQYAVRVESTTHSAVTNKSVTLEIYYMDKTKFNEA